MNIGLIGVGGHGAAHLHVIHALEREGLLRLQTLVDPNATLLDSLSAELPGVSLYASYEDLLASGRVPQALVACLPIPLHESVTLGLLSGCDARILLEKPSAPTLPQWDSLVKADSQERVRVGYQMIFWPHVIWLKRALLSGLCGKLIEVRISAGWPRPDSYYQRARWAGKMEVGGQPVFDGPATNALSHLLHLAAFLLGDQETSFAWPEEPSGSFYRARPIESYDTFIGKCLLAGIPVQAFLTHACAEKVPFAIQIIGSKGSITLNENQPVLEFSAHLQAQVPAMSEHPKEGLYRNFVADSPDFALMPSTLYDSGTCIEWVSRAFETSGGVRDVPERFIARTGDGVVSVSGIEVRLGEFRLGIDARVFP